MDKSTESNNKIHIGRLEKISIPDFGINNVDAKIDTGAYRGSIHVSLVEEVEENNEKKLRFTILDKEHPKFDDKVQETKDYSKKIIKNSSGEMMTRYVVPIKIIMKGKEIKANMSLSDRAKMRYPILIGRRILDKHFLVDVNKKFTE